MAFDRGPTPYFHGRKRILHDFCHHIEHGKGGTTFLIQGAPGAWKTALLYECKKLAREHKWQVADIHPDALWSMAGLMRSLGRGDEYGISEVTVVVDIKLAKGEYTSVPVPRTVISILKETGIPLLLILDEAQTLGTSSKPSPEQSVHATNTLKEIHNGSLGKPVVLLAAGLGTTLEGFASLGISRFGEGTSVELGALSKEAERAVIYDWLTKKGGATGDPTAWMDAIVQETHQWPLHVHSYAKHAGEYLEKNGGVMTSQGLKAIMELGQRGRIQYYKQRVASIDGDEFICLAEAITGIEPGQPFKKKFITESIEKEYNNPEKADKLFNTFLEKGLIAQDEGLYSVPIPSMHSWMKSELERIHARLRQAEEPAGNKDAPPKSIGPVRDVSSPTTIEPEKRTTPKLPVQSKEKGNPPKDRGSSPEIER